MSNIVSADGVVHVPSAQETISGGAKEADGLAQQVEEGQESC